MRRNTMSAIKAVDGATKAVEALYELQQRATSPESKAALLKKASKEARRAKRLNTYLKKVVGL